MSRPVMSKRVALICGLGAVGLGAAVVLFSANAATVNRSALTAARPVDTATTFRGDVVAGKSVLLRRPMAPAKVDWQAAMDQTSRMEKQAQSQSQTRKAAVPSIKARLPRPQLDKTRLPVILPRDGGIVDTAQAKMVSFGDAYALNMPQPQKDGVQITVYGNRTFVAGDSGAVSQRPFARLAGVAEDIRISQMEDGWTATFTRFGVVYSIDVSCDSMSNPDCQNDGFIRNVITQMDDVTMGSEARGEAEAQVKADNNWLNQITKTVSNITRGG